MYSDDTTVVFLLFLFLAHIFRENVTSLCVINLGCTWMREFELTV